MKKKALMFLIALQFFFFGSSSVESSSVESSSVESSFVEAPVKFFRVQGNPPPTMGNSLLKCDCSPVVSCMCELGEVKVAVDLSNIDGWENFGIVNSPWGDLKCSSGCIGAIGRVVSISLPFLKYETLESSESKASAVFKKSLTMADKVSYAVKSVFSALGLSFEGDNSFQLAREKTVEAMKTKSEKASIDLTTYFILELTKDITLQDKPSASAVGLVLSELLKYNSKGELQDLLSSYFYLKAKNPELFLSSNLKDEEKAPIPFLILYRSVKEPGFFDKEFPVFLDVLKRNRNLSQDPEFYMQLRVLGVYAGLESPAEVEKRFSRYAYEKILKVDLNKNSNSTDNSTDVLKTEKIVKLKSELKTFEKELKKEKNPDKSKSRFNILVAGVVILGFLFILLRKRKK